MTELKYWLWLTASQGMTPVKALMLLDHFVTPERIYYADGEEYGLLPLSDRQRQSLEDKSMDRAEKILEDCQRLGVDIMTLQDAAYPQRLIQRQTPRRYNVDFDFIGAVHVHDRAFTVVLLYPLQRLFQ